MTPNDTTQLILETEQKVALQWANTSGNALSHSQGFSFRSPGAAPCKALSRVAATPLRVVRPTRHKPSTKGSSAFLALLFVLVLGLGIGYAAQAEQPPAPEVTAPLMW